MEGVPKMAHWRAQMQGNPGIKLDPQLMAAGTVNGRRHCKKNSPYIFPT